jgi:hypothetical protein
MSDRLQLRFRAGNARALAEHRGSDADGVEADSARALDLGKLAYS